MKDGISKGTECKFLDESVLLHESVFWEESVFLDRKMRIKSCLKMNMVCLWMKLCVDERVFADGSVLVVNVCVDEEVFEWCFSRKCFWIVVLTIERCCRRKYV